MKYFFAFLTGIGILWASIEIGLRILNLEISKAALSMIPDALEGFVIAFGIFLPISFAYWATIKIFDVIGVDLD